MPSLETRAVQGGQLDSATHGARALRLPDRLVQKLSCAPDDQQPPAGLLNGSEMRHFRQTDGRRKACASCKSADSLR